jgi:hypothetical protein
MRGNAPAVIRVRQFAPDECIFYMVLELSLNGSGHHTLNIGYGLSNGLFGLCIKDVEFIHIKDEFCLIANT